ncbi:MAG: hypothetical protein A2252_02915 [Elusimicrobia bacterium RIFOXYA2_FULL_39_19]|nr:MAG: hypothetical protein A2252_02915 [Elusimicrobia bacterium RIFOXYA2_FULL_39_19]
MDILNVSRSKLTRDLLGFYFANADKEFYLRELEKSLHHSVGNIRRQLKKFEKIGLFYSSAKGNLVFFRLNKKFHLYNELKSMVTKTVGISGLFKAGLSHINGIEIAFIYGSFAKGNENEKSDIDLCVVGKVDNYELIKSVHKLETKLQREINYTLFSSEEFKNKRKQKGGFVELLLKEKIIPITGDPNA